MARVILPVAVRATRVGVAVLQTVQQVIIHYNHGNNHICTHRHRHRFLFIIIIIIIDTFSPQRFYSGECPSGTAWADKAYATDLAHQSTECSNAGYCDRKTGNCVCYPGFSGSACQRGILDFAQFCFKPFKS